MKPAPIRAIRRPRSQHIVTSSTTCILFYLLFAMASANAQIALPGPGLINTIAGNGTAGYGGDGGSALSAELYAPNSVAVDSNGNIYIADNFNSRIRKIAASTGTITTVAGNGTAGYSGDGGAATSAELNYPNGVAVDGSGNIYIADTSNERVRKVTVSTGVITTVAGNGTLGYSGDGGAATHAELDLPNGIAIDSSGNIYIADSGNRIRKVNGSGIITTIAGNGTAGYSGDGGAATSAELKFPNGIAVDSSGNIYIADTSNERVRKVTVSTGIITTVAGNGTLGYSGDGGAATSAELGYPWGVAVDSSNNIYIADDNNKRIREVSVATGTITTVAGNGTAGYSGDGGGATHAELNGPQDVAVDKSGNIYIADTGNSLIRAVGPGAALSAPAVPNFSPAAGNYLNTQTVTISDTTSGAVIYYTTDGTTPTTSSTQYTGPLTVSSSETINAIAVSSSISSAVATAAYTVGGYPTFSPVGGTYTSAQVVSITSAASGATIYYTTNGTTPTTSSTQYTGPFSVGSTETIEAIAIVGTMSSSVSTATYTINLPSTAWSTATITVNGSELTGDSGTITVSFNGFVETVSYGEYSTLAAIASAFGAKFSNDYLKAGLCAHASGSTITFKLKGATPFGTLDVTGSTGSFQLQGSGFASQVLTAADFGAVSLTVNGVVSATTNYGDGATPSSIAEGLAANITSDSPVNVTAANSTLFLQSKQAGAGTNYSYTVQTTSWDSTNFTNPSFAYPAISGNLQGGINAGSQQQTLYSYSIPSYVSGSQPTGYDADGNIVGYSDSVMGTWSMASGYDTLNRLTAASATAGTYSGLQINWGYDMFGNRTSESFSGSTNVSLPTGSTAAYTAGNQISSTTLGSVQYDSSGDVTMDNQNQYLYDGEGRVCAVKNLTFGTMNGYIYGADGTRVSTGTIATWGSCDPTANGYVATKDTILGPTGGHLTETGVNSNGNVAWEHTNVWAGGQLLATYDPNGIHFYVSDWTGSRRVQTNYEGVAEQTCTNLPYGNGESCSATPTEQLYAGLERDSESGLDHAMFRQYSSAFGRWTTPDPYGGSYDLTDPQSMNRYTYVGGSPFSAVDPSGLDSCSWDPDGVLGCTLSHNGSELALGVGTVSAGIPYLSAFLASPATILTGGGVVFGELAYDFGESFGWWGGGSSFHGNVSASQSGKNVPSAASAVSNTPLADPDDERIRQLAVGINNEAGWIATPQGVAGFYGASLAGAGAALAVPALGAAANEALLGPAEERLFWSGGKAALDLAEGSGAGQTIGQSLLGRTISATLGNGGNALSNLAWQGASRLWAAGASGPATAFILRQGYVWTSIELPELFANSAVNPSNLITWPSSIAIFP